MSGPYHPWEVDIGDFYRLHEDAERLKFLLRFSILAPSSHNAQPWKFSVEGSSITVSPDFRRSLAVSDPHHRHLHIALGCALANLRIAAEYYGLPHSIDYLPKEGVAARVRFDLPPSLPHSAASREDDHLIFSIPKRAMNRAPYGERMPDPIFLRRLTDSSTPTTAFDIITSSEEKAAVTDALLEFRDGLFGDPEFRAELSRFKRTNITRDCVGMPGFTMGFSTPLSLLAPWAIRHFNVMRMIKKADRDILLRYTPVFLIVSSKDDSPRAWMDVGECIEKMMLEATRRGISVAISAVPHFSETFRRLVPSGLHPQAFFRIGYAKAPPRHSPRLPVERVTA